MAEAGAHPEVDAFVSGLLFFDLVLAGLPTPPTPGEEVWASGTASGPGGIANFAVALARLGLRTQLAAAVGSDLFGDHVWRVLTQDEGIDLSRSRRYVGWPMPVTVALAWGGDRALVTHGLPAPIGIDELVGTPPPARAAVVHLRHDDEPAWPAQAKASGTLVFGDVGWDPQERWDRALLAQLASCHAFFPNEHEAMGYTRTADARSALSALADLVPLAVVTCGGAGAIAVDATTGERAEAAGLAVDVADPTGAGDVFGAGLVAGTLAGWPLEQRLRFATLCAALSVTRLGGAPAAPGWPAIAQWWAAVREDDLKAQYGFLDDVIPARRQLPDPAFPNPAFQNPALPRASSSTT